MGLDRYTVLECIGEGSFGRVFRGRIKETGQIVALKFIPRVGKSEKSLKNLKREIEIMRSLHHTNIIAMKDTFETEREVVAVTDYAEGDLFQVIEDDGRLPEDIVRSIACQLVSALYYLHAHRILHRDMKPQNILLGQEGVVKLCDFGFARVMTLNAMVLTSIKLVKMITKTTIHWPEEMSTAFRDFLTKLLQKDVRKRLQWPDLLDHPFVAEGIQVSPRTRLLSSPFTQPLTPSQVAEKERQTKVMSRPNGSRVIRRTGNERPPQPRKLPEENRSSPITTDIQKKELLKHPQEKPNNVDMLPTIARPSKPMQSNITGTDPKPNANHSQPPTPRPNRISEDYERDKTVREQYMRTQSQGQELRGNTPSNASTTRMQLDNVSDLTHRPDNRVPLIRPKTYTETSHASASRPGSTNTLASGVGQNRFLAEGWWLRESADAWERLVDATDVDLISQTSMDQGDRNRQPQRRTAMSLMSDTNFASRVAMRLVSASVIKDVAAVSSSGQSWVVALAENRIIPSRQRSRPVSADQQLQPNDSPMETTPGLEAASYLRTILRLLTNLITIKCDVSIVIQFCHITQLPTRILQLIRAVLQSETLHKRPWYEQILLDLIITINAYFVSEIGHSDTAPDNTIQEYMEHALTFIGYFQELVSQSCDREYQLRDQTLLCLRYMMERLVDKDSDVVLSFHDKLYKKHRQLLRGLLYMPAVSRKGSVDLDAQRLDEIREHGLAALTAFTYPVCCEFTLANSSATLFDQGISDWVSGSPKLSVRTHELAIYIADQLCLPEFDTYMRLYLSYLWNPQLCIHTAKLFYDCIQASVKFTEHCVTNFPQYLDILFELLQKKVAVTETDQFTLTDLVTHSLTALVIQLDHVPVKLQEFHPNLCRMFVESQTPSHAAALALLLSRLGAINFTKVNFKPQDLAQSISHILVSPLVQSQTSRSRLISAIRENVQNNMSRNPSGSGDQLTEYDLPMTLGIPQLNWPANHGWLDGVFELTLAQCSKMDSTFAHYWLEHNRQDRVWQCVEHVFNAGGVDGDAPLGQPDWVMLSPRGVCTVMQLGMIVYTKNTKLCSNHLLTPGSPMFKCLRHLFSPTLIDGFVQNVWNNLTNDGLIVGLLATGAELLKLSLNNVVEDRGSVAVPQVFLHGNLLSNLMHVAAQLHARPSSFRLPNAQFKPQSPAQIRDKTIRLARLQSILTLIFDIINGPYTPEEMGANVVERKPTIVNSLCAQFSRDFGSEADDDVKELVFKLLRWCLTCPLTDLRVGASILLIRVSASTPAISSVDTTVTWQVLRNEQSPVPQDHLLSQLITDGDAAVRSHALLLLATLITFSVPDSADRPIDLDPASDLSAFNTPLRVHLTNGKPSKLYPPTYSQWLHHFANPVAGAAKLLSDSDHAVRQTALLVLANALSRFDGTASIIHSVLGRVVFLLTSDSSARVRTNAAICLANLTAHMATLVPAVENNSVLNSLLETSCLDGDRRVQEASLTALHAFCVANERLRTIVISLNANDRLQKLLASVEQSNSGRNARRPGSSRPPSSLLLDYNVIIRQIVAIQNCLKV